MLTLQSLSFLAVKKTHGDNLSPPLQRLMHRLNEPVLNEILSPFVAWYLNTYRPEILDTIVDLRTARQVREEVVDNLNTIERVYEYWSYLDQVDIPNLSWDTVFEDALDYDLDFLCDPYPPGFTDPIESLQKLRDQPSSFFKLLRLNSQFLFR